MKRFNDPVIKKIDILRAFHNLWVDPRDAMKLGISWGASFILMQQLLFFGWLHGTVAFELCRTAIDTYLHKCDITMLPYIDDGLFILERHSAYPQFQFALDLIRNLGLPVNLDKLCFPTDVATCLGLVIDIPRNTLSIDVDKLADIAQHCEFCLQKTFLSKHAFQSLLGKLFVFGMVFHE